MLMVAQDIHQAVQTEFDFGVFEIDERQRSIARI
jgi:hypothetical protein